MADAKNDFDIAKNLFEQLDGLDADRQHRILRWVGWITRSGKDVAAVLRDYRNYVHPEKQRSHGVSLNGHDAQMFWDVTRNLLLQLLGIA